MTNQIVCEKRSYTKEINSHHHDFGQFLFPLQGTLDIKTEEQKVNLDANYCLYLPPKCVHSYRSRDRNEFLILDIPMQYLPHDTDTMYLELDQQWDSIRYLLLEEAKSQHHSSLIALTRFITSKFKMTNFASIHYIHKNFKEKITLETLAEMEHYHPVYYSSWFKKQTGKSLKDYLSELRLREVKHLLVATEWSISKIGEEISFENTSSFSRWFVRCTGISPSKYRMLHIG